MFQNQSLHFSTQTIFERISLFFISFDAIIN